MKKWTYLVAAGILLGATPVFTGCIDNDEPEGITVLRGAKAELLKAKASVAAASVEQIKAEAALKLAEAEVKKAEAARIQAIADYEAAKAKEMEYKAELANIQNEEARADLENKIKMYAEQRAAAERAAQAAAAQLEVTLMNLKAQLATQEALYEQALKDLALAKNTLTEAQQKHLQKWTNALDNAQKDVKSKAEKYETAVKLLAELTKTMDKTEAKESYLRTEKKAVEDAKAELDAAIAARDLAKEYAEKCIAHYNAINNNKELLEKIQEGLAKFMLYMYEEWKAMGIYDDITKDIEPVINGYKEGNSLLKYLTKPGLYIELPENIDEIGYVIQTECPWEPEHMCAIVIRENELKYVGPSEGNTPWDDDDEYYCIWNDDDVTE